MRRSLLWGLLAWVVVVALASGMTWAVINRAGQTVLADDVPLVSTPDLTVGPGTGPPLPTATAGQGTGTSSPTSPPPAEPTPAPPSGVASPSSAAPPGSTGGIDRRWEGEPGSVVVRCTGRVVDLRSATPSDDYRVEVESRGPREVEVKFEGPGDDVKVKAKCEDGVPQFGTEGDEQEEAED
ncbi:hypothetical protein [Intrasporangium sp.]|uniref:hypothetical protein n=1 Tax=Intrasporangium sp. TaxID=1925024 RepID=UPI00293A5C67|nr:hypothetical protein [Intrasporangium sp.]MDV3222296.1 hypothetical protein [Intrasporangium sp.]